MLDYCRLSRLRDAFNEAAVQCPSGLTVYRSVNVVMSNDTNEVEINLKAKGRRSRKASLEVFRIIVAGHALTFRDSNTRLKVKVERQLLVLCVLLIVKRLVIDGYPKVY